VPNAPSIYHSASNSGIKEYTMDVIYRWRRFPLKGWILVAVIPLSVIRRSGYQSLFAQLRYYGYPVFCSLARERKEGRMIFSQKTRGDTVSSIN
jgi:hypothetical protein